MGFDPNQFVMGLIGDLGQQIRQGRQQGLEDAELTQLLPQLQGGQDPEQILNTILQTQFNQNLSPQTKQRIASLAGPVSQVTKQREQQELRQIELQRREEELSEKKQKEFREKSAPVEAAQDRVTRMRSILSKGTLGRGSGVTAFFGGETARDKSEFEQLGKSLISFATNIPIRNRLEFEALAGQLLDATQPINSLIGTLDAMERIITDSLRGLLPEDAQKKFDENVRVQTAQGPQEITVDAIRRERERRKQK